MYGQTLLVHFRRTSLRLLGFVELFGCCESVRDGNLALLCHITLCVAMFLFGQLCCVDFRYETFAIFCCLAPRIVMLCFDHMLLPFSPSCASLQIRCDMYWCSVMWYVLSGVVWCGMYWFRVLQYVLA